MSKNTDISELINYISVNGSGHVVFTTVPSAASNTDKFLVSDSGVLKFRTAAQLLSDIGAQASGSYQTALSGTGFVKISGSIISYDNSTYLTTSSASSTYLPLTGGTLGGGLTINGNTQGFGNLELLSGSGPYALIGEGTGVNQYGVIDWNASNNRLQIATQPFAFGANGGQITLTTGGLVGIGTTSPNEKLEVQNGYLSTYQDLNVNDAGYGVLFYTNGGGSKNSLAAITLSQVGTARSGNLLFQTSNSGAPSTKMIITSVGNVGINSSTNNERFVVRQTTDNFSSVGFYTSANTGTSYGPLIQAGTNSSDAALRVFNQAGTTSYLHVRGDGNVGVNTPTPLERLSVTGNIHVAGVGNSLTFDTDGTGRSISQFAANLYDFHILNSRGNSSRFILGNTSISLGTSATPMFYINTTTGNIGIGTTSPGSNFHVEGPTVSYGQVRILSTSASTGEASIHLGRTNQTLEQRWTIGQGVASIGDSFGFYTVGSPRVVFTTAGNVGIGVNSPTNRLHVVSGDNEGIFMQGTNSGGHWFNFRSANSNLWSMGAQPGLMGWYNRTDSTYKMIITDGGNVGIGTSSPTTYSLNGRHFELNDAGGGYSFIHNNTTSVKSFFATNQPSGLAALFTFSSHPLTFGTANTERMRISSGGDVIKTTFNGFDGTYDNIIKYMASGDIGVNNNRWIGIDSTITAGGPASNAMRLRVYQGNAAQDQAPLSVMHLLGNGNVGIGTATPQQRLSVEGSTRINRSIYSWYQAGTNSWDYYQFLHLKTNMWAGGSPNGNIDYTMSLFYGRLYSYSSNYVREGHLGFHNWSGVIYNPSTNGTFWSGGYTSSDGYVVLVVALGGGSYLGVTIDWHQAYGYPLLNRVVTAATASNSGSGVF